MGRYEQALREVQAQREAESFQRGEESAIKKVIAIIDSEWLALDKKSSKAAAEAIVGLGEKVVGLVRTDTDLSKMSFTRR